MGHYLYAVFISGSILIRRQSQYFAFGSNILSLAIAIKVSKSFYRYYAGTEYDVPKYVARAREIRKPKYSIHSVTKSA